MKQHKWYSWKDMMLVQAGSLQEVLDGAGDRYWFSGKHLYVKITDDGDASVEKVNSSSSLARLERIITSCRKISKV